MATPPEFSDNTAITDVPSANSGAAVETPLLRLRGITKSFGAVQALRHVDLDLPAGKVTALIGDNGAGKSTLIKTISGIWGPTSGTVEWDGRHVEVSTPRDAAALGIATVYQDLALATISTSSPTCTLVAR